MSIHLWEGSQIVDVCIMRYARDMSLIKSQLGMTSNLLGTVSEKLGILCCGGVAVDVLKTLDELPSSKDGLQYLFSIHQLQIEKLLIKPSYSVMGRIDKIALLKSLSPLIVDCVDFKRMRRTLTFTKFVRFSL